ncbi:MAG: hypothetical protein AVDCRST_MAG05-900 [uncultured Rubrobacteraceae bacterium]|uniref:CbiN domain protein n=1 Tax=uncultured Rubrobacteraceae bacterium TaxID=349277 RepID=A0A6J4RJY0_9ACTN|nr:MAG: hypothetical protein AVDCRST_MAG05-900 [uncultured Rubrobacteraceae bacterium]
MVLAASGLVFLLPDCASACTCALEGGSQEEIVEGALSESKAVFSGEVVAVERGTSSFYDTVTLRASEVWKGPGRATLEVDVLKPCGNPFKEGRDYLVYAYGKRGLKTDICTETKPLEKAGADLAVLGDGERSADGGVLSDTSGGASVPAMVGVAWLALAASVLVVARLVRPG